MIRLCAIASLAAACGFSLPASPPPSPAAPPAPTGNLAHCIRLLTDEAEKSKSDGALVRNSADFAKSFADPPPMASLTDKFTRRIHNDPFIDAYIRWQLTSFKPALDAAAMTDREFERLLDSLPPCIDNPRAHSGLLESLQKASARGALSEAQQQEVNDRLNALAADASRADALNQPALQLRAWLADHFAKQPYRLLMLLLADAHAQAKAGWPIDDARNEIDKTLETVARLRDFTPQQRRDFILAADKAMVKARMFVASAGVSDNALNANYATTGIFDYDVRRWTRALADER